MSKKTVDTIIISVVLLFGYFCGANLGIKNILYFMLGNITAVLITHLATRNPSHER